MKTSEPNTNIQRERNRARELRFDKAWKRAVAAEVTATDWLIPARVTVRADAGDYCVMAGTRFRGCGYCAHIIANRPAFEAMLETGERMLYTPRTWYASELVDLTKRQKQSELRKLAAFLIAGLRDIVGGGIGGEGKDKSK